MYSPTRWSLWLLELLLSQRKKFANSFVPMTSRDLNSLPTSIIPTIFNLHSFKTQIHRDPFNSHPIPEFLLLFFSGSPRTSCIQGANLSSISIINQKSTQINKSLLLDLPRCTSPRWLSQPNINTIKLWQINKH